LSGTNVMEEDLPEIGGKGRDARGWRKLKERGAMAME